MSLPWLSDPRRPMVSPRELPKLEAWFDALDTRTMLAGDGSTITDGGSVALWADKSGNSNTLCYVSGVAASNSVSSPNKSVTGNQTFTLDLGLDDYSPAGDLTIVSKLSGNDGFAILLLTTGVVRLRVGDGASVTNVDSTVAVTNTNYLRQSIGIVWTDGVGASFTLGGSSLGDAVVAAKTLTNAAVACTIGTITGRIYRVQVGSVYDFNPASTTAKKLANGDTLTTGGDVWTLASSGATGARIAGERDLFNGVLANRPVYIAPAAGASGLNSSAFAELSGSGYDTFTGASATGFSATKTGTAGTDIVISAGAVSVLVGKQYRATFTLTLNSGSAPVVRLRKRTDGATVSVESVGTTAGANSVLLTCSESFANAGLAFSNGTLESTNYTISDVTFSLVAVTKPYLYFDGSNDYLKTAAFSYAQPESIYFVGSQVGWTADDSVFAGNVNGAMVLGQSPTTPRVVLYSGSAAAENAGWATGTNAVVASVFNGASSSIRINRGTATTGNPGTTAGNGFTVGANGGGAIQFGNITASEIILRSAADATATQDRIALYAGRKWGIAV